MKITVPKELGMDTKDMGFWKKAKAFHGTGWGKAAIYGTAVGLGIKVALGYGLYKAGQASGKKQPKKYMAG